MSSIIIPAGTTWAYGWPILDDDGTPIDLTGWKAEAQVRANKWVWDSLPPLHEWSSESPLSNITLFNSTITISVDPDESASWCWLVGVFQLILTDTQDRVSRVDELEMRVTPSLVREVGSSPPDCGGSGGGGSGGGGSGGGGGSSDPVRHNQLVAANVWPIAHNLGYYPASVSLYSSDLSQNYEMFTVQHLDVDNLRVAMELSIAGVALVI